MAGNRQVLGDTQLQTNVLESNASAVNYHRWLCSLAEPYLGEDPLEIGSGIGNYAETWLAGGLDRITLSEADPHRLRYVREKFAGDSRVHFATVDLDGTKGGNYSCVMSFNVMEHIPDDVAALRAGCHLVRPGGFVLTFAPAFPLAMSRFDRRIGHVRRYTTSSLRLAYGSAGLQVERCHYVNAPGLVAWIVAMRLLGMTPKEGPALRIWDRYVVPYARWTEGRYEPPFGQSVLCVGRRPSNGSRHAEAMPAGGPTSPAPTPPL